MVDNGVFLHGESCLWCLVDIESMWIWWYNEFGGCPSSSLFWCCIIFCFIHYDLGNIGCSMIIITCWKYTCLIGFRGYMIYRITWMYLIWGYGKGFIIQAAMGSLHEKPCCRKKNKKMTSPRIEPKTPGSLQLEMENSRVIHILFHECKLIHEWTNWQVGNSPLLQQIGLGFEPPKTHFVIFSLFSLLQQILGHTLSILGHAHLRIWSPFCFYVLGLSRS